VYGVEAKFNFVLFEVDGVDFRVDAAHAAGDTKIMKDEGAEANTTNGFVDEGQGYSITISATEMQAARIMVYVVDQGTKAWLDTALVIETYGHASAMHAFDLDTATVNLSAASETQIDNIETDTNELQGLIAANKIAAQVKGTDDIDLSATQKASVNAEVDTALAGYDGPTKAEMDTAHALLATVAALTVVDTVVDAIKAKTDNLPADPADDSDIDAQLAAIAGYLDTEIAAILAAVDTEVAAILADTGTDGVVISTATAQAIADEILKRSMSNVEATAGDHTLAALVLAVLESVLSGTTWTIKKTDGSTTFLTKTVTTNAAAEPVVEVK